MKAFAPWVERLGFFWLGCWMGGLGEALNGRHLLGLGAGVVATLLVSGFLEGAGRGLTGKPGRE